MRSNTSSAARSRDQPPANPGMTGKQSWSNRSGGGGGLRTNTPPSRPPDHAVLMEEEEPMSEEEEEIRDGVQNEAFEDDPFAWNSTHLIFSFLSLSNQKWICPLWARHSITLSVQKQAWEGWHREGKNPCPMHYFSSCPIRGRENLCKKCAEMRWFFKKFSAKTLQKMRWNVLTCAETLQETRWKRLSLQKIGITENRSLLFGAAAFTQSNAPKIPEHLPI